MLRYLPFVIELALVVYCLIDLIQTDSVLVRNLSKGTWVLLIVFLPIVGSVAWLVAGRPTREQAPRSVPWPATQTAGFPEYERPRPPKGPDDDAEFLADLRASDAEHEKMLAEWEATLRSREARLRDETAAAEPAGADPADAGATASDEDDGPRV